MKLKLKCYISTMPTKNTVKRLNQEVIQKFI